MTLKHPLPQLQQPSPFLTAIGPGCSQQIHTTANAQGPCHNTFPQQFKRPQIHKVLLHKFLLLSSTLQRCLCPLASSPLQWWRCPLERAWFPGVAGTPAEVALPLGQGHSERACSEPPNTIHTLSSAPRSWVNAIVVWPGFPHCQPSACPHTKMARHNVLGHTNYTVRQCVLGRVTQTHNTRVLKTCCDTVPTISCTLSLALHKSL